MVARFDAMVGPFSGLFRDPLLGVEVRAEAIAVIPAKFDNAIEEARSPLDALQPPSELAADHGLVVQFMDSMSKEVDKLTAAIKNSDSSTV